MRLVLWAENFWPRLGGASVATHQLALHLTCLGIKVCVIADQDGQPSQQTLQGIDVYRYPLLSSARDPKDLLQLQMELQALCRRLDPDIFHASGGMIGLFYFNQATRKIPRPRLVTLHMPREFEHLQEQSLQGRAVQGCDWVVFVSQAVQRATLDAIPQLNERSSVIPNGYPEPLSWVEPPAPNQVGFIGRFSHQKGMDTLLTAWKTVQQKVPEASLRVWGAGAEEGKLRGLADGLSVEFKGQLEPADVTKTMQQVAFLVLPSRKEGHPLVALEAAAAGRAIVGTRIGGMEAIIEHGHQGILVPVDDPISLAQAIIGLINSPTRIREMGWSAHSRAKQGADWGVHARTYLELYERLCRS